MVGIFAIVLLVVCAVGGAQGVAKFLGGILFTVVLAVAVIAGYIGYTDNYKKNHPEEYRQRQPIETFAKQDPTPEEPKYRIEDFVPQEFIKKGELIPPMYDGMYEDNGAYYRLKTVYRKLYGFYVSPGEN